MTFVTVTLPLVLRRMRTGTLTEPRGVPAVVGVAAVEVVVVGVGAVLVTRPVAVDAAVTVGIPELATVGSVPVAAKVPAGSPIAAAVGEVVPPIVAAAVVPLVTRTPPASTGVPSAPLLMPDVGCELIDEFTVSCGFVAKAGFTNAPVWMFCEA